MSFRISGCGQLGLCWLQRIPLVSCHNGKRINTSLGITQHNLQHFLPHNPHFRCRSVWSRCSKHHCHCLGERRLLCHAIVLHDNPKLHHRLCLSAIFGETMSTELRECFEKFLCIFSFFFFSISSTAHNSSEHFSGVSL